MFTKRTSRRLVSKIAAVLDELATGRETPDGMVAKLTPWMTGLREEVVREAAHKLREIYPLSAALRTNDFATRTRALGLVYLAANLPEPLRSAFGGVEFFKQG